MMREERRNLLKYVLVGAVGFGIGNALLANLLITNPVGPFTIFDLLACIVGSITCGASLGIISGDIKRVFKLSTAGVIWFIIGFVLYPLLLVIGAIGAFFISPLVVGMIGGVSFSVALKKKTQLLAITCILGCSIGLVISSVILGHIHAVVRYVAFGLITGAFIGAGVYLTEKTPTNQKEKE